MDEKEQPATGAVEETSAPIPEGPSPAETEATATRDASVAVMADEVLTEDERRDRANYLVTHPDERTAHDPVSADGQTV